MINKKVDDVVMSSAELRYILPILYIMRKQLKSKNDVEQKIDELVSDYRINSLRGSIVENGLSSTDDLKAHQIVSFREFKSLSKECYKNDK